jgi:hypothetical protein
MSAWVYTDLSFLSDADASVESKSAATSQGADGSVSHQFLI